MATPTDVASLSSTDKLSASLEERNRDFHSRAVENALKPYIEQVTTLTDFQTHGRKPGGKIRKASKLVQIVDKATGNFLAVGEELARENLEFQEDLLLACDEIRAAGEMMHRTGSEFAKDTFQSDKRAAMVSAARELLLSVTRLMVIADAIDVHKLLTVSRKIEEKLRSLQGAVDEEQLMERIRDLAPDITHITQLVTLRQAELKSEASQQLLVVAQTELNQTSKMLIATSKAFLQHRDLKSMEENSEYVITRMLEALKTLSLLADGEDPFNIEYGMDSVSPGDIATAFWQFESTLQQTTTASDPSTHMAQLQHGLDKILAAAAGLADSELTRDYRQHAIISLCGKMKKQMQMLLSAFKPEEEQEGRENGYEVKKTEEEKEGEEEEGESVKAKRSAVVDECVSELTTKTAELHKELHRAVIDHISESFVDPLAPLGHLCRTAQEGNEEMIEERVASFTEHAKQMEKVSLLACSLSLDIEELRMVKVALKYVRTLRPQVANAASTLTARPRSHVALKNMAVFKETWEENVSLLRDCVSTITPLADFLSVIEAHISEDREKFLSAMDSCDVPFLRGLVNLIHGRCSTMLHVVQLDVGDNPNCYGPERAHRIEIVARKLSEKSLPWFYNISLKAADTLESTGDTAILNRKVLEEASLKVLEDFHNVMMTVLHARSEGGDDLEGTKDSSEHSWPDTSSLSLLGNSTASATDTPRKKIVRKFSRTPTHSNIFARSDNIKTTMAQLPIEQQAKLAKATRELNEEKDRLDTEMKKWGDRQSDIIVAAKEMCLLMMDISDFTRGIGRLGTAMDVIVTAKDITRAGEYLGQLTRKIAEECPDKQCKKDLLAYLERIQLCCQQMKITSTVKPDSSTSLLETVDNASALISAAKNLMNIVALTVKTSYIASTAIARQGGNVPEQFLQWRLAAPKQKNLISGQSSLQRRAKMMSPLHQLREFVPDRDIQAALEGRHQPDRDRTATPL